MTINSYILPMTAKRVIFLVYDGFEIIDLSGPLSAFASANTLSGRRLYHLQVAAPAGGAIPSGSGLSVDSRALRSIRFTSHDTVLAVGAELAPLTAAMQDKKIQNALCSASAVVERIGSVCSGALLLGVSGLLDGRRCTTHWAAGQELRRLCPTAEVDLNALYVADQSLWTSAGATTGIDMALSMIEEDHGVNLMLQVAKWLVVYAKRPGHQTQFSPVLRAQAAAQGRFSSIVEWIMGNLDKPIRVGDLAERASMSERSFYRQFTEATGTTPFKLVETLRLDRAKALLEAGTPAKSVAAQIGFRSETAFRTAFKNAFGTTPSLHARMFSG